MKVRVVSETTSAIDDVDDNIAAPRANFQITRYQVPKYCHAPDASGPDVNSFRHMLCHHASAISGLMPALVLKELPDVCIVGHEQYASFMPEIIESTDLPYVQLLRGTPTWQLVEGGLSEAVRRAWVERFARADMLVPVASYLARGLRQLRLNRVSAIANGVNTSRFSPGPANPALRSRLRIGAHDVVVLHPSHMQRRKRVTDIVDAASLALKLCPDLLFLMVGEGYTRAEMEEHCRQQHVQNRFRFAGMVDYQDMPAYYRQADIVVMPSEGEGMSRVYLETLASGKVLVASDIPAAREIVDCNESGVLFRLGDHQELAQILVNLACNLERRRSIGHTGRRRALHFGTARMGAAYVELIESIVGSRSPVRRT